MSSPNFSPRAFVIALACVLVQATAASAAEPRLGAVRTLTRPTQPATVERQPASASPRPDAAVRRPSLAAGDSARTGPSNVPTAARTPSVALGPALTRARPAVMVKAGEFNTRLEVQTIKSDVINDWGFSHAISTPQTLRFRWSTQVASPQSAVFKVLGQSPVSGWVEMASQAVPVPPAGQYGFVYQAFPDDYERFKVEVVVTDAAAEPVHSIPVHIDYGAPSGPSPSISLPKLVLTIDEIAMIDDSDDLSTGEIDFCFWAEYSTFANGGSSVVSGLTSPVTEYRNGDFDSGATDAPGIQVVVDDTPKFVTLHVKGRDDDTSGGFTTVGCGGSPSEYDFANGSVFLTLPTGATGTAEHAFPAFVATGSEDLEFEVRGTWQIVP